ncbi:hypothetical protein BpHYR1_013021 [Brachionus plicatilis]|uniref:Uncharacterized protein n=1 Tax=Brachionus plicatilis TaxID=10195 RepID=A0A3M7R1E1_BRAPC|nr:hypothetical protein BpHYR1_013021 [Brachionus plicatilis]
MSVSCMRKLVAKIEEKEKRLKELELKSKIWLAADNWKMDPLEVDHLNKYNGDPDETILPFTGKYPKSKEIPLLSMDIAINMQDPREAKRKFQEEVLLIFGSDNEL